MPEERFKLTTDTDKREYNTEGSEVFEDTIDLSEENKARLFNFRIDDNSYNLKLYAEVLKKLGIHMYGSEGFEDNQSIYGETMKTAEKHNSQYECRYDDKKMERGRGR